MWLKHGDPLKKGVSSTRFRKGQIASNKKWFNKNCKVNGCEDKSNGGMGMCHTHYMNYWRYGNPIHEKKRIVGGTALDRFNFWHKKQVNGCWEWQGALDKRGYGRIIDDTNWRDMAHRWSYKHFIGNIPSGLVIDHLCHNPKCVNPKHLEPVTYRQNTIERGVTNASHLNSKKTHCLRGHELTENNIYIGKGRYGNMRVCKICHKERVKKYLLKKKG